MWIFTPLPNFFMQYKLIFFSSELIRAEAWTVRISLQSPGLVPISLQEPGLVPISLQKPGLVPIYLQEPGLVPIFL